MKRISMGVAIAFMIMFVGSGSVLASNGGYGGVKGGGDYGGSETILFSALPSEAFPSEDKANVGRLVRGRTDTGLWYLREVPDSNSVQQQRNKTKYFISIFNDPETISFTGCLLWMKVGGYA